MYSTMYHKMSPIMSENRWILGIILWTSSKNIRHPVKNFHIHPHRAKILHIINFHPKYYTSSQNITHTTTSSQNFTHSANILHINPLPYLWSYRHPTKVEKSFSFILKSPMKTNFCWSFRDFSAYLFNCIGRRPSSLCDRAIAKSVEATHRGDLASLFSAKSNRTRPS